MDEEQIVLDPRLAAFAASQAAAGQDAPDQDSAATGDGACLLKKEIARARQSEASFSVSQQQNLIHQFLIETLCEFLEWLCTSGFPKGICIDHKDRVISQ